MLSLRAAGILSTTLEAVLYGKRCLTFAQSTRFTRTIGFSVFMFMLAMWILLRDRSDRHVNYWMVSAGCGLFVLSTAVSVLSGVIE